MPLYSSLSDNDVPLGIQSSIQKKLLVRPHVISLSPGLSVSTRALFIMQLNLASLLNLKSCNFDRCSNICAEIRKYDTIIYPAGIQESPVLPCTRRWRSSASTISVPLSHAITTRRFQLAQYQLSRCGMLCYAMLCYAMV